MKYEDFTIKIILQNQTSLIKMLLTIGRRRNKMQALIISSILTPSPTFTLSPLLLVVLLFGLRTGG